jgi:hypothetical protein
VGLVLKWTMAVLSKKATDTVPCLLAGSPFCDNAVYKSITIGAGIIAVIDGSENSSGCSKPSPGHTHIHLSSERDESSICSHNGLPDEHSGQLHDPHEKRSKLPLVQPNVS